MKKIFYLSTLLLAAVFAGVQSFAQFSLSCDPTQDTIKALSNNGAGYTFNCKVTNNSTSPNTIVWNLDVNHSSLPSGWIVSACDNNSCYAYNSNSHTSSIIAGDSSAVWATTITPSGSAGGTAYVVTNMKDNSNATKIYVDMLTMFPLGVSVVQMDDNVTLFPNPANNEINVVFNVSNSISSIAITNLIGKVVSMYTVTGNSAKLNIEHLPSGIYFARLIDVNNNVVTTRKFTKQ